MDKYTIYIVTRQEASASLGVPASELDPLERKAKVPDVPGRGGYTACEFRRLAGCAKGRRGKP